nr:MAG TPA: hypothetical protein [Caudoviricetes sp.]
MATTKKTPTLPFHSTTGKAGLARMEREVLSNYGHN